jgi:hypothetical protein
MISPERNPAVRNPPHDRGYYEDNRISPMKTILRPLVLVGLVGATLTFLHRFFGLADLIAFGAVIAILGWTLLQYLYPRRFIRLDDRAPQPKPSGDNRAVKTAPPDDRMAA